MQSVLMTMRSVQDWIGKSKAEQFAHVLINEDGFLLPEKVDNREPERFVFDAGDLTKFNEVWTDELGWVNLKRKKPYLSWIVVQILSRASGRFNEIRAGFDDRYLRKRENVDRLLSAAVGIYNWGAPVHGYLCHEEEWNAKNYFGVPTAMAGGKIASSGGTRLEEGLPGIYWANYFGPLYVEFFGRKKWQEVPAYHKEELGDGGYFLLTAPGPLDFSRPEVRNLQERIIDHLGRDAFFEKSFPLKLCRTPQFAPARSIADEPETAIVAYDPVSQGIPDPQRFVNGVRELANALAKRLGEQADFSPESLNRLDDFILAESDQVREPWTQNDGRRLLQELTAYYGEVLRRSLGGRWLVVHGASGDQHPVLTVRIHRRTHVEYPFVRIIKLWLERERADGLSIRYDLLQSGQLEVLEQYLEKTFHESK